MSKSIYSLVLDDELVLLADRIANKTGKSRSAIVNTILAKELGYETPEMKVRRLQNYMKDIFDTHNDFGVFLHDDSLVLRSVLSYRYNPTIRYSVDVHDQNAVLKVVARSKTHDFMRLFDGFTSLWCKLECLNGREEQSKCESGKYTRFFFAETNEQNTFATAISEYVRTFDSCLKMYFSVGGNEKGQENVKAAYTSFIKEYSNTLI